jgi:hypothetical protein
MCDLDFYEERVWVEAPPLDGENLLISNYYFPPDVLPNTVNKYFSFLENKFDTKNCMVILLRILTLSVWIGNAGYRFLIVVTILNLRKMLYTPLNVFLD